MERLDIRDKNGRPTGKVKERALVHRDGDLHGTAHLWILRENAAGRPEVLLQKRSADKDAYPGCYDISSAGHIPAGETYLASALRELSEELGIRAREEDLIFLGMHEGYSEAVFYGKPFRNHEISAVYLYTKEVRTEELHLQEEEVESVKWMDLEECLAQAQAGNPDYCVFPEELAMIADYLRGYGEPDGV